MDTPQMLLNSKRPHWKRSLYKREDSSKTLIIIIVILVVVAVLILGGLVALVVLRHRARKRGPQEEVADATSSDKPQRKWPWKKQENVRQDTEEDKQLRDAVKQMMLNNNVPLGQKPEQKKVKQNAQRRLRLDAASATETFQARNALQEDGDQFSHFVNFTSSKFQTESSGGNKEDDSYLF
ncbi:hypothetical protein EDD86DRAFT_48762 [Gorgonomyces haynaldii]|nr:hypothetical protein EDD86DRAFT_48762 [Gorgonomyces haynaldii]